jgi:ATP-dependent helicase/nuclease subunit A
LNRILEHSGYLALAATTPGGVEAGDILHAVDRVRQVVEEGGSLADAADSLEADADDANEVESLPLEPGRTDVVRVMNLHKAKGLEADVVFLADPAGGVSERIDVHIKRTGLKAQGWFKVSQKFEGRFGGKLLGEHADWSAHEIAERPYLQKEEDRLLYVAATRARQMLVVSRSTDKLKSPAWGVLDGFLSQATELAVPQLVSVPEVTPLDCSVETQAAAAGQEKAAHGIAREASWSVTSVTAEARHIARITRSVEASTDDPSKVVNADTPAHRADAGQAWGTLIHGLLEHAMRHPSATRDDLRRLAVWLTVDEPQLRPVIDEALDTVERTAKAGFWQAAKAEQSSVETPFFVSESGRLTNGVIDLLFRSPDGWQIVDYKTDLALTSQKYEAQLDAYRDALRKVGCDASGAAVVSVRSHK